MAIVQRPLAAVIAAPRFPTPTALQGQTVGITGVPSDTAVLDSIVTGAGGNPHRVHTLTIGFNAVPDLLAGRVSAATAFWSDEGVTLQRAGRAGQFHDFRVDDYGAPHYPELVVCATRATLSHEPGARERSRADARRRLRVHGRAIRRGARPTSSRSSRASTPRSSAPQLTALLPAFAGASTGASACSTRRPCRAGRRGRCGSGSCARRPTWPPTFDPEPRRVGQAVLRLRGGRPSAAPLACHPRARDHELEPGVLGRAPHVRLDVRVEGEHGHARRAGARPRCSIRAAASAQRSTISTSADKPRLERPDQLDLVPARARAPPWTFDPNSRSGMNATTRATTARGLCGTPRAPTPAVPTSARARSRPARCGARAPRARRRSPLRRAAPARCGPRTRDAAWPNRWATSSRQCQSLFEYGWALQVTSSVAASM